MARWILALLLLAMAAGQIADPGGFVGVLETYEVGGRSFAWLLGIALIAGEVVAGTGLLARPAHLRRVGAVAGVVVATAWSALAVQAFARGLALDNCGCFGVYLSQPLRWWVLLEDAYLIGLSLWVWRGVREQAASRVGSHDSTDDTEEPWLEPLGTER